jgi:hypothetical protein
MKLLRYGPAGQEKPGALDAWGQVRDLSVLIEDIGGDTLLPLTLARLRQLDLESLPRVPGTPQRDLRLGPCVGPGGQVHLYWPELCRSRGRVRACRCRPSRWCSANGPAP